MAAGSGHGNGGSSPERRRPAVAQQPAMAPGGGDDGRRPLPPPSSLEMVLPGRAQELRTVYSNFEKKRKPIAFLLTRITDYSTIVY